MGRGCSGQRDSSGVIIFRKARLSSRGYNLYQPVLVHAAEHTFKSPLFGEVELQHGTDLLPCAEHSWGNWDGSAGLAQLWWDGR